MKKILLIVVGIVAVAVLGLLGVAASQPDEFHLERSTLVTAPREAVYPLISDFHRFGEWSPWEKLDPNMKRNYSGAESGLGAVYEWEGNDDVGSGRMTIVDAVPSDHVEVKLEFFKPWDTTNRAVWSLADAEGKTKVTWVMEGRNNGPFAKAFAMLMMESVVGKDFDKGLAQLKSIVEGTATGG